MTENDRASRVLQTHVRLFLLRYCEPTTPEQGWWRLRTPADVVEAMHGPGADCPDCGAHEGELCPGWCPRRLGGPDE